MNRIPRMMKAIGMVVLTFLISWTVVVASNQITQNEPNPLPRLINSPTPQRPHYCVPIPIEARLIGTLTPTPDRFSPPEPNFRPTITPFPYTRVYDLNPELPLSEKSEIVVFRCNGEFDKYLAGPNVDIDQAIELGDGDTILSSVPPASLMGHEPPEPADHISTQISPISTSTAPPYPPPPLFTDTLPAPYPFPDLTFPGNPEP